VALPLPALTPANDPGAPEAEAACARRPIGAFVTGDPRCRPTDPVKVVADRFFADASLPAIALCADGRPRGLVTRANLLLRLARGFGADLWSRRPVAAVADPAPLVLSEATPLDEALGHALARPAATVYDEIVVADAAGLYRGLLPVRDLALQQGLALARARGAREAAEARARDLEAVEALRARFLAHATHELRSPVNAICVAAELARLATARGDLEAAGRKVAVLLRTATTLRCTVNEILDLSRLEAGQAAVSVSRVALGPLLEEVAGLTRLLAGEKPVAVSVRAEPEAVAETDALKLRQILVNLAANAAKFTAAGEIELGAAVEDGGARAWVRDTGPGIAPEDLPRLFVAFGQLEDAREKQHEGTGLGLVITRSLAALLGARVEVASAPGAGSTFTLHLPPRPPG
jgi:signal transduction histidine kinase